jgi:DMSO/TMAO reductase YedYZ heme-binding membrane subunit
MKDPRFAKFVVFTNSLVPLALLCYDYTQRDLGPNPIEFSLRTTGMLALLFLVLSLTATPLRKLTGQNFFSYFRRMLGLFAFFYGCLHLLIYFFFDRSMSFRGVLDDIFARPFIAFGMGALLAMLPLALTSTAKSVRRLGAKKWKQIHRMAYVAAIAGAVHYYLLVKADTTKPVAFITVIGLLFLIRVAYWLASRAKRAPTSYASADS